MSLFFRFFFNAHYVWGTMMLVPFLLNHLSCWYVWATTDKRKAFTWVAALLSFYPQFVACKIIWLIWTDPKKGLQKKQHLQRNLIQMETFMEATPSTLIMVHLLIKKSLAAVGHVIIFDHNDKLDRTLFWVAFSTSIITSSLGLAKNLKVGPCRILPAQKGYLSLHFLLIFLSCGSTLVAKGFALAIALGQSDGSGYWITIAGVIALATVFLPGLLTGLAACWHKGILRTFFAHPSVFLLPVFSFFTFASNTKVICGGKQEENEKEPELETFVTFSAKHTAINIAVSCVGLLVYADCILAYKNIEYEPIYWHIFIFVSIFFFGLLHTLAATFSNQINCCRILCYPCCSESFEMGALLVSSPHTPYILGPDGQLRKEATEMDSNVKQEQEIKEGESKQEEVSSTRIVCWSSNPTSNILGSDDMEEKKEETSMEEK